jgi:hypothetical protein
MREIESLIIVTEVGKSILTENQTFIVKRKPTLSQTNDTGGRLSEEIVTRIWIWI